MDTEYEAYGLGLATLVQAHVQPRWDWQGLALSRFEKLNAGLLALAAAEAAPASCRCLTLPPGTTDEVCWPRVAALDAYLRTQRVASSPAAPAKPVEPGELLFCDAPDGTGWVAEAGPLLGHRLRVKSLLDDRREADPGACRRLAHNPYAGKNLLGGYYSNEFLEWQQRIRQGVAQGRRLLRQAAGFVQPTGATAIIVTDVRPSSLKRLFQEMPYLPAVYAEGTRDACYGLPVPPRIWLVDKLEDARTLAAAQRRKNSKAAPPHLYVTEASRYRRHWAELPNQCAQDDWASVTLLGTETDEAPPAAYAAWRWTAEELDAYFGRRSAETATSVRLKLTAVREPAPAAPPATTDAVLRLQGLVANVLTPLEALAQGTPAVRPRPAYHLLNAYLRYILPPGQDCPHAAAWLQRQQARTRAYLAGQPDSEEDPSREEFANAFYEAGIFAERRIEAAAAELNTGFQALHDFFQTDSPKHRHLTSSLKKSYHENPAGGRYVVADRDSYAEAHATYHDPERQVSVLRLYDNNSEVPSFQRIMRSPTLNASAARFLVPFVFNREQYELMSRARGQVKLFLYEQLEEGKLTHVRQAAERRDEARLLGAGRRRLCGHDFEALVAQGQPAEKPRSQPSAAAAPPFAFDSEARQHDFFAQLYAFDEADYGRETQDRVVETRPHVVRFATGESTLLDGSKNVLRQEPGGYVRRPVAELAGGDAIVFYENEDRERNYQILLQQDRTGVMARIEYYSQLWRATLDELDRHVGFENVLYNKLRQHGFPVRMLSLRQYLAGIVRFPMHEATLRAIQQLARAEALPGCGLCDEAEFRALLRFRARFQSLAHGLGRGLSDELLRYHVTGRYGPLLTVLAQEPGMVEALSRSIKQRTVLSVRPA